MLHCLRSQRLLLTLLGCALAVAVTPSRVDAGFKLFIDGGTESKTITDEDLTSGDMATGQSGTIVFFGSVGNVSFTITTGVSKGSPLATNNASQAQMDLQISATTTVAGTYTIMLTDTDFSINGPPPSYIISNSLMANGITNASLSAEAIVDTRNSGMNEFTTASDVNGTTVFSAGELGPFTTAPVNAQNQLEFAGTSPFSLNQIVTFTTTQANGGVLSVDFKTTVTTPAPAGVVLLFSALPALGAASILRRRRRAATTE